eukprot:jgi/Bigna1/76068/fgenesh1_pg.38_\
MKKIFNFGIRIDTSKFHNENDDSDEQKNNNVADSNDNNDQQQQQLRRPYMLYMGKCCEEHWELSYTPRCRDSPGCSSKPGIAYDNTGTDLYHPSVSCEVECVVHHDPQAPIDVVLTGGTMVVMMTVYAAAAAAAAIDDVSSMMLLWVLLSTNKYVEGSYVNREDYYADINYRLEK